MKVTVILNGNPVNVEASPTEHFYALRWRTLRIGGYLTDGGVTPDTWEIRDARGAWIDPTMCLCDFPPLTANPPEVIYLSLPVGHGA